MVVMLQCFKHDKYGLKIKVFAYIKNEGVNLDAMTTLLKIVVSFKSLGLEEPLQGTCFGHALLKACQYGTTNLNFVVGLHGIFIKSTQIDFQKCITWLKNLGKRHQ